MSEPYREERHRIRTEMGGAEKIARLHEAHRRTAREHLANLLDADSFTEVGMFARSERAEDRASTPADGKICGHGTIEGRPVTVAVDDVTVKRATSSLVGARKLARVYEQARRAGNPFVYIGETGGARLPDSLSAAGYSSEAVFPWLAPQHAVFIVTLIALYSIGVMGQNLLIGYTGQLSFGQAGFLAIGVVHIPVYNPGPWNRSWLSRLETVFSSGWTQGRW